LGKGYRKGEGDVGWGEGLQYGMGKGSGRVPLLRAMKKELQRSPVRVLHLHLQVHGLHVLQLVHQRRVAQRDEVHCRREGWGDNEHRREQPAQRDEVHCREEHLEGPRERAGGGGGGGAGGGAGARW